MSNSAREGFLERVKSFKPVTPVPKLASVYSTHNEIWLYVMYSGVTKAGGYWFGIDTYKVREWENKQRFVACLICGDENNVVLVPDERLFEWYSGVAPNRKGHWMANVWVRDGALYLHVGKKKIELSPYVNRYDLISIAAPRWLMERTGTVAAGASASTQEVERLILDRPDLEGASLHERVIEMLAQIGKWMDYEPRGPHQLEEGSPYVLDLVWLRRELLEVAIEVQVGGSETEAKDRLTHARRFGARKVIAVSTPDAVSRLKKICRYEPDIKSWLEIWSISKVFDMYVSGRQFFSLFRPFEEQRRRDEIEVIL